MDRRRFLQALGSFGISAASLAPVPAFARLDERARHLKFFHTHTGEKASVVYRYGDNYSPEGLAKVNYMLRDHRQNEATAMDPHLIDFLYDLQQAVGDDSAVHIISGYRTKKTNDWLRSRSSGVSKRSQHLYAKALDLRIPGVNTKLLRDTAWNMQRGGVGYYKGKDFIHIDTARVRFW